ncbi:MAG: NACHT domain-containing NTPase [Rhizonema sp. PD38]|nr:NACHT domain-containing NTPase [Rhizonema sp. PD38]
MRLTVKATPQGLTLAQNALMRLGGTQLSLANELKGLVGRSTIQKFFNNKEIQVDKFKEICKALTLESQWEAIAGLTDLSNSVHASNNSSPKPTPEEQDSSINIDALTKEVREKVKSYIRERCGTMRVLDMTQPIGLGDIYTDVNILEKITGRKGLDIPNLLQNCNPEEFDRFGLGQVTEERISGLEAVKRHSKLMILGKPGAGKTTFLKHLALQCINSSQENRIPFFITLKQFSEICHQLELPEFIVQQLGNNLITNTQLIQLLESGRFLLLLDGLDEVKEENSSKVINHIKEFSERYRTNKFIITCRIAAREEIFEKFTEVELADFDKQQIKTFVTNWFQNQKPDTAEKFIQQLQSINRINELATNPLLLTLLCLEFEGSGDFPSDRADLYKRAIRILLRYWDAERGIVHSIVQNEVYTVEYKEKLLTEVAWTTFDRSDYFFRQTDIERYIQDYIRLNLPRTDPNALQVDSEVVLKSIEAHHGLLVERARSIYSFSHITFHEYFTARKIVDDSREEEDALKTLASKIFEKRWQEVFLLTVGLSNKADVLLALMKQHIDALLASDTKLQQILTWVEQKSESVEAAYKPAAIRAFYLYLSQTLDLSRTLDIDLSRTLDINLSQIVSLDLKLDFDLFRTLDLPRTHYLSQTQTRTQIRTQIRVADFNLSRQLSGELSQILNLTVTLDHNGELQRSLQELEYQLLHYEVDNIPYMHWWQEAEKLRTMMIEHRNIGHDWQFNESQKKLLRQHYDANKLLVDCLNSSRYVSREVRQKIEDTLLLPVN